MKILLGCEGLEHKEILKTLIKVFNIRNTHIRQFGGDYIWHDTKLLLFVEWKHKTFDKRILVFDEGKKKLVKMKAPIYKKIRILGYVFSSSPEIMLSGSGASSLREIGLP